MSIKVGNVRKVWLCINSNNSANPSKPKTKEEEEAITTLASDRQT